MDDTQLEESLVWEEDGCLAEPALHAVADGELEILPEAAREHAHSCTSCAERIGNIAMFSLEIEQALAVQSHAPLRAASLAVRRKLPVVPIALALAVALTSKLPLLRQLDLSALRRAVACTLHVAVPVMLKLITFIAHSPLGSALVFASAAFLLASSALVARNGFSGNAASIRQTGGHP